MLECYTLHAIERLEGKDERLLVEMTPKLQEVYKVKGTWIEIIEKVMELPQLRKLCEGHRPKCACRLRRVNCDLFG